MNKVLLAAAMLVAVLTGCADLLPPSSRITLNPARPLILVTPDNRLIVNQEPIIVPRDAAEFKITWQLPRDSRAKFNRENGVTVEALDKLLQPDGNPAKATAEELAKANRELRARAKSFSLFPCTFVSDYEYSCLITVTENGKRVLPYGLYAYTVRVTIDGKPFVLDPRFMI